tara:strand:- start:936 stop:1106 length:171 start_codon:yes stop_codon:yes gene_type:complete
MATAVILEQILADLWLPLTTISKIADIKSNIDKSIDILGSYWVKLIKTSSTRSLII